MVAPVKRVAGVVTDHLYRLGDGDHVTYDANCRLFDARPLSVSSEAIGSFAPVEMSVQLSPW